jgi:hypothetical protein
MDSKKLKNNIDTFLRHIDAVKDVLPATILQIQPYSKKAQDDFSSFLKLHETESPDDEKGIALSLKITEFSLFEKLERNAYISSLAPRILTESLFVYLISQYDAFFSKLLEAIFEIKPEILNQSERSLTLSQLKTIGTIEKAQEYIIEKEVETVLRDSHSKQFEYLENKLNMKLRENLPIWKTFIEITERRNLFVHNNGIVSNHYTKVCIDAKCENIEKIKIGTRLNCTPGYFVNAYKCLYELAVKLTHTIWRKLLKDNLEEADSELNNTCYNLINVGSYQLADILLEFACGQRKHYDQSLKKTLTINKALSKYLQEDKSQTILILKEDDWTACSDVFQLAHNILLENYDKAYNIISKIGNNGDIPQSAYMEWPLFTKIRKERKFKELYKSIFKEEYKVFESPKTPSQELIKKEIAKTKKAKKKKEEIKQDNNDLNNNS